MKGKSILGLILSILVIAGAVYLAANGIGSQHKAGAKDINLGLDLAGGVSITYTTVKEDPEQQDISDTIYKLQKRLAEQGYTEGEVYKEGTSRINVDIPGATDANQVLKELGEPGNIQFIDEAGNVVVDGSDIKTATATNTPGNLDSPFNISLEFNAEGVAKFAEATTANVGKTINIVYNGQVIMTPTVSVPITDGNAEITRLSSMEEASNIASTIRIGALPLELKELRSNVVGAKLGQDAITTSLKAGFISIILIFIFMIVYYRLPGFAASLGLALYTGLIIILLSVLNLTLTLPGIAGIILSIGMAVDANVIIFARIREELRMEKTLRASAKSGFSKALSAIIDGNITTMIAAVVLYIFGTGPIQGFATTLALGIIVSMFTALFATRFILWCLINAGFKNKKWYGVSHELKTLPIIEKRNIFFAISIIVIAAGLIKIPFNLAEEGTVLKYDIEFAGGTSTLVSMGEGKGYASYEEAEADLTTLVVTATGDETPQFQNVKGKDQVIIKTSALGTEERISLESALIEKYGITNSNIESESISPTVSDEMKRDAFIAIFIASACILLYITFRFKGFDTGVAAIASLLHDILIVFAVYSLLGIPANNSFIAAMLTILGYSINDTIVVFDRIRENQKHMKRGDYKGLINNSITQTFSRSINTSLTTIITITILYFLGVSSVKQFALPLIIGIFSGTYSSIFIASPLWYLFKKKEEKMVQTAKAAAGKE